MVRIKNGKKDVQQNYKKCNNEEFKTMQITWKSKVAIFEGVKCIRGSKPLKPLVAEKILDEKKTRSGIVFLVKWKDFSDMHNLWICEELLESSEIYIEYMQNKRCKRLKTNHCSSFYTNALPVSNCLQELINKQSSEKEVEKKCERKMPEKQSYTDQNFLDAVYKKMITENIYQAPKDNILDKLVAKNRNALKTSNQQNISANVINDNLGNKKINENIQQTNPQISYSNASYQMNRKENMKENKCQQQNGQKLVPKILSKELSNKFVNTMKSDQKVEMLKKQKHLPTKTVSKSKKRAKSQANYPYEVEEIVGDKLINGKQYYLIKWKGYDSSDNTWEPVTSFAFADKVLSDYKR